MHMLHMCTYLPIYVHQIFGIYSQVGGHICFCTYLVMTCEVEVAVGCVLAYINAPVSGAHGYIACWLCELYLECDIHICSVIYVYSTPC